METKDVAVSKGTTHLVSKEDFCRIVNFAEPSDIDNLYAYYDVRYVVATRGGKDLVASRSFQSIGDEGAGGFIGLLNSCDGAKVLSEPEKKVAVVTAPGDVVIPRLVDADGKIITAVMREI